MIICKQLSLQETLLNTNNLHTVFRNYSYLGSIRFLCLLPYQPLWVIFDVKTILVEEKQWYYLTYCWGWGELEGLYLSKHISPKVNNSATEVRTSLQQCHSPAG